MFQIGLPSLVRKLLSALASAAGKNFSAVSGRHSFTEAVFHLAMTLLRLVRSFHNFNPPFL